MTRANFALWFLSLLLQCSLLGVLWWRGLLRKLPAFAALIAFYILRSSGLLLFRAHLRSSMAPLVGSGLAVTDLLLQIAVAWELFSAVMRFAEASPARGGVAERASIFMGTPLGRAAGFGILLPMAVTFAALLSWAVPANPRFPMDRGVLFASGLFLLLLVVRMMLKGSLPVRRVVEGLACYATASVAGQIGRAVAAVHRDARAFAGWSYVGPVAYLVVVLFWVVVLWRPLEADE